jgi:hypothetical protein
MCRNKIYNGFAIDILRCFLFVVVVVVKLVLLMKGGQENVRHHLKVIDYISPPSFLLEKKME